MIVPSEVNILFGKAAVVMKQYITALILLWTIAGAGLSSAEVASETTLFEGESPYTSIRVFDRDDGLRFMSFGRFEQTATRLGDPDYIHYAYIRTALAAFAMVEQPVERVLLLGLGGGTLATYIQRHFPEVQVDVVEIDPLVVKTAKTYFGFEESAKMRVHIEDGRTYLRRNDAAYDVIILDAYKAGGIPFHLTTREFMQLVKRGLKGKGVAAAHLWGKYANKYIDAQIATMGEVFKQTYLFETGEGSFLVFNTLRQKWLDPEQVAERGRDLGGKRHFSFDLGRLIKAQFTRADLDTLDAEVLTDDFAPVNLMREQRGK